MAGISVDITEYKRTEQALKKSEEKLKILNADKDRFISILGHDLIAPFSPILGILHILSENIHEFDISKIENLIKSVNASANNVYNLLEETLIWANAQSGKLPFEPQKLLFSEICREVIDFFKPNFSKKNISVEHIERDEIFVFADKNMVKTILRNLISNAIKFTKEGGIINIRAEKTIKKVIISVSDNGIGISTENIKKLLDSSGAFTTTGTAYEQGTGLGLVLCKEFIAKHGGLLSIESEPGKGSTFKITLPAFSN